MNIRLAASDCPNGWDCPKLYETDEGSWIVQGYTVTDPATIAALNLHDGETAVRVTAALVDEARDNGIHPWWAQHTPTGDYLVHGATVTTPDVLAALSFGEGEHAVIPTRQEALL